MFAHDSSFDVFGVGERKGRTLVARAPAGITYVEIEGGIKKVSS